MSFDSVIITNVGLGGAIDDQLGQAGEEQRIWAHSILNS